MILKAISVVNYMCHDTEVRDPVTSYTAVLYFGGGPVWLCNVYKNNLFKKNKEIFNTEKKNIIIMNKFILKIK